MNIYIFGDLEFAYFVLNGVTMLFSNDDSFIQAAFILSLLFLMWSFIKWSMNPEKTPYPVREFAMGLIFFLIFGGTGISPKFQVTLISANNGAARIVTDVPFLAAAPSWLATNLFKTMTDTLESGGFFVIPGYEFLRNYQGPTENDQSDPLAALVQLSKVANSTMTNMRHETNIANYIQDCYSPDVIFRNVDKFPFMKENLYGDLWQHFRVTNVNLMVEHIAADLTTSTITCPTAYANIAAAVASGAEPAPDPADEKFSSIAIAAAMNKDIAPTAISRAAKAINMNLTGAPADPNPFTIMTNMFLATTIKEGIADSSLSTWSNKMVFEAERKRTVEAAGERSLFMNIYIPTITAIECFSFYIAPILMILSILGGFGFSLIGKYLMLVLFINLWSFIKVFVDIFTALSLSKAFQVRPFAGDAHEPFQFARYMQSILEAESLLTVASNLTMAIPFFAMFLLYGGIHSVMGVMRTVTGGAVDGANMAPTMSTTMAGGSRQMGDTTQTQVLSTGGVATSHSIGSNAWFGDQRATNGVDSQIASTAASLNARQQMASASFTQSTNNLNEVMGAATTSNTSGNTRTAMNSSSGSQVLQTIDTHGSSVGQGNSAQAQVVARLAAMLGVKAAVGPNGGSGKNTEASTLDEGMSYYQANQPKDAAGLKQSLIKFGINADLAGQLVSGFTQTEVDQFNKTFASARSETDQRMSQQGFNVQDAYSAVEQYAKTVKESSAFSTAETAAKQISDINTAQTQLSTVSSNSSGLATSNSLNFHAATSFDYKAFEGWYNKLGDTEKNRISELGYGNSASEIAGNVAAATGLPDNQGFHGSVVASKLLSGLHKQDDNLQNTVTDSGISTSLYKELSQHSGAYGQGFQTAAETSEKTGQVAAAVLKANGQQKAPDVSSAESVERNVANAQQSITPVNNNTDQQQADRNAAPGHVGSDGNPTTHSANTGRLSEHFMEPEKIKQLEQDLSNFTMEDVARLGKQGVEMAKWAVGGIDSFADMFRGRDMIWGQDAPEIANRIGQYATTELGNKSLALESGIAQLTQASNFADMTNLFHQLNHGDAKDRFEAAQQISQMNDAYMFMNTKEGMSVITSAFTPEDGARLLQNAVQFNAAMSFNKEGPLNSDTFDALSRARMNGEITDNNADMFLQVHTGGSINMRGANTQDTYDSGTALRYMLNDSPLSADNSDIQTLSSSIEGNRQSNERLMRISSGEHYQPDSLATKEVAYTNIARDEDNLIRQYGGYGSGDVQQGVNLENKDSVVQNATMNFVQTQLKSNNMDDVINTNSGAMERAFGGSDLDRQQIYGAVSSQGPLRIADRFESMGLPGQANKITSAYEHLDDYATRTNLAIPQENLDRLSQDRDARINELPSYDSTIKRGEN